MLDIIEAGEEDDGKRRTRRTSSCDRSRTGSSIGSMTDDTQHYYVATIPTRDHVDAATSSRVAAAS